jgi:Flp pilus assembly protein CpaB
VRLTLDRRTLIGIALAVIAAAGVFLLTQPPERSPILVAGADLPSGVPLPGLPLEIREVDVGDGLVSADHDISDLVLASPIRAGEPLLASLLEPTARMESPDAIAVTLDTGHAAQGDLMPGDLVDVYATFSDMEPGTARYVTERIADDVLVIAATADEDGFGAGGEARILLAVDDDLATALVFAIRAGEVDLVRVDR